MKNYLQWLAEDTPTKWWHDSAIPDEIDRAIQNGASGVTTNPVLTYRSLCAVPEFWKPYIEQQVPKGLSLAEHAEALLKVITTFAADKFRPIFDETDGKLGYALAQVNPGICMDSELMLEQGKRYASWAQNIAVKIPTVKAAIPVVEELAAQGIAVCTTLNFSVSQAMAVGEAYMRGKKRAEKAGIKVRPIFVVQQGGRLDDYLLEVVRDNRLDIAEEDLKCAGNYVCHKVYNLFRERGIDAKVMPAGLRGVHHLTAMAGADMVFSLQSRIQEMTLKADPEKVYHIDDPVDYTVVDRLRAIPEFRRAYDEGGLDPNEFVTFGVTQKTLSQFLWTGWVPLETYANNAVSDRWF